MYFKTALLIAVVSLSLGVVPVGAAGQLGDAAPALRIADWIKGGPVDLAAGKGKNIFVIEFWATWCPPCRVSIPHLTELQRKYKDKGVVIVSVTDEPRQVVEPFVKKLGDSLDYVVAVEKGDGTSRGYMVPFGIRYIPYAFVVDKTGVIAWHGSPGSELDSVLERMVQGKFDVEVARNEAQATILMEEYFQLVGRRDPAKDADEGQRLEKQARATGDKILIKGTRSPDLLNDFAMNILLMSGIKDRDLDLAGRVIQAAYKGSEQGPADHSRKLVLEYFQLAQAAGLPSTTQPAAEGTRQMSDRAEAAIKLGDAAVLNAFARVILTVDTLQQPDFPLALRVAETANRLTHGKDPVYLDIYALALFKNGQRDKAVEQARKAIKLTSDPDMTAYLQDALRQYERGTSAGG